MKEAHQITSRPNSPYFGTEGISATEDGYAYGHALHGGCLDQSVELFSTIAKSR